jgi:hypothetical protein
VYEDDAGRETVSLFLSGFIKSEFELSQNADSKGEGLSLGWLDHINDFLRNIGAAEA